MMKENMDMDVAKQRPFWRVMLEDYGVSIVSGGDGPDPDPTKQQAFDTGVHDAPPGSVTVVDAPAPGDHTHNMPGGGDPLADPLVQDAINRARQDEKDKLYETINELKTSVTTISEREQQRLNAIEAERAAAEQAAREAAEAELDTRTLLERRDAEWSQKFEQVNQQFAQQAAVLEQERRRNELTEYRTAVLDQVRDKIHPTLVDFVRGNTPEEIDAAAQDVITRSSAIMNDVREVLQQQRMQTPMSSVTQTPGPETAIQSQRTLTPQEIAALPMSEYEKLRPQLLAASGQQYRGGR